MSYVLNDIDNIEIKPSHETVKTEQFQVRVGINSMTILKKSICIDGETHVEKSTDAEVHDIRNDGAADEEVRETFELVIFERELREIERIRLLVHRFGLIGALFGAVASVLDEVDQEHKPFSCHDGTRWRSVSNEKYSTLQEEPIALPRKVDPSRKTAAVAMKLPRKLGILAQARSSVLL